MEQYLITPPDHQQRIEELARFGATQEDIAAELRISLECVQEQFQVEYERGQAIGKHIILEKLFHSAASGSNLAATALWVKARCGWRDTGAASSSPDTIYSILEINTRPAPVPPPLTSLNPHSEP